MDQQILKLWNLQGIDYREKKVMDGKIAFVFPGHGSQYPDMMSKLYEEYDVVRDIYDRADKKTIELMGERLTDHIFTKNQSQEYVEEQMKRAEIMQIAIYTANYAMHQLVTTQGIKPDYLLGHSLGEFSSLVCAGVFTFEEGLEIVYNRANVLNHVPAEDRGTMFSVKLDSECDQFQQLLVYLQKEEIEYTVSIINSKEQVILSIPVPQVDQFVHICAEQKVVNVQLKTSHGFHSPILSNAAEEFYQVLLKYSYQTPDIPVLSSILENFYFNDKESFTTEKIAQILKCQFVKPFHFQKLVERLYSKCNVRYFIEIGADSIMTKLLKTILDGKEAICISTDSKREDDRYSFAKFVSQADLYQLGKKEKEECSLKTDFKYTKEEIRSIIVVIVAEKTGYPEEILEDELDFEMDLGIDSVKQADIVSKIFVEFKLDAEQVKEQFADVSFNTIKEVTDFLYQFSKDGEESSKEEPDAVIEHSGFEFDLQQVTDEIKEIIAKKTGYPVEILEEDMDFEADLGIDSVKQADIVSTVLAKYEIEKEEVQNANLDVKIDTIKGVAELLKKFAESTSVGMGSMDKQELTKNRDIDALIVKYIPENEENLHKRYVSVSKRVPYNEEAYISSYLNGKHVIVIEDGLNGSITKKIEQELIKQQAKVVIVSQGKKNYSEQTVITDFYNEERLIKSFKQAHEYLGSVDGVLNLYGITEEEAFYQFSAEGWNKIIKSVFQVMMISVKEVYDDLAQKEDAFCVVAGNIGGIFGVEYTEHLHASPAIMVGFLKALKRELPNLFCKAIDFEEISEEETASLIIKEMMTQDGLIEVGYTASSRKTIVIVKESVKQADTRTHHLTEDDVIVFGGGGRGIMYEFAKGILEVYGSTVVLTGRTEMPEGTEPWLNMSETEFEQYKSDFMLEKKKENADYSVIDILSMYESRKHTRELYRNIQELKKYAAKVYYFACDVRDIEQVRQLYQKVKQVAGDVTGIVNGAGLPAIGKVRKKELAFAEQVVVTKCMGFYNLYTVFQQEPLRFFHSVGSISGRLGMDGQVDYCAGSDVIVKMTDQLKMTNPDMQVLTMEWTAWNEVGMATDPTVEKIQNERGLTYISVNEGVQRFLEEVSYGGTSPEVLIFDSIGREMESEYQTSFCTSEYNQKPVITDPNNEIINRRNYPLIEKIQLQGMEIEAEKTFYIEEDNFLSQHKVNGAYVFAGVCHMEFYAEIARYFLEMEGIQIHYPITIKRARFINFVKYFKKNPLTIRGKYKIMDCDNGKYEFHGSILSDFVNNKGVTLQKDRLHSDAILEVSVNETCIEKQSVNIYDNVQERTILDVNRYYEAVEDSIVFGNLYRHVKEVYFVDRNHYIGQVIVDSKEFIVKHNLVVNTMISPITIDCVGRVLLVGLYYEYGISAVPVGLNHVVIMNRIESKELLIVDVQVNSIEGNQINADFIITKENGEVIVTMNIDLQRIKQYSTYGLIGNLDV